jgi:alpha-L-fucosidase
MYLPENRKRQCENMEIISGTKKYLIITIMNIMKKKFSVFNRLSGSALDGKVPSLKLSGAKTLAGFSLLLVFSFSVRAQLPGKGDEQGLEVGRLDLHQDSLAVSEALAGWWKASQETLEERMSWYNEAKFGCFIHWGVYSAAGGEWNGKIVHGYAEHLMRSQKIPLAEYRERLVKPFYPAAFDADEWMRHVRDAGMRYFIITAKHHDGFAMFPSDAHPYDIRLTAFPRDPMKELREAARKYDVRFGFYYSHAFDWEHPDAPGNDWDYNHPGGDRLLHGANWWMNCPEFLPHAEKYVTEKSIPQIQELIRNYQPDILWFDTPGKLPLYENIRILKAIREMAPDIVINGRLVRFGKLNFGDYVNTGDRAAYFFPVDRKYWEAIPTTNESYGYSKHDHSHKPSSHFIRLLASATAKGGNILMNVGPTGDGKWDTTDVKIFEEVGAWLKINGDAIYGNVKTGVPVQNWGVTTRKDDRLYLHIYRYPKTGRLVVGGLSADVAEAYLAANRQTVKCEKLGNEDMLVRLPAVCPDTVNTVVVLQLKNGDYTTGSYRLLEPGEKNILLTFDALLSKGLSTGDGKKYRNYIHNWTDHRQSVTWNVRLRQPASYRMSLEYNKLAASDTGVIIVVVDGKPYKASYAANRQTKDCERLQVATVELEPGEHTIVLKGEQYQGKQFMRPMQLTLE